MPQNLLSIQYLRGIAAIMVVYFHTKPYLSEFLYEFPRRFGYAGVDIFFCISGFIMMYMTVQRVERPAQFLWKRMIRIFPMFWLATALSIAIIVALPWTVSDEGLSARRIFLSVALIAYELPPILRVGWTLVYEMYFYILFAIVLLIPSAKVRLITLSVFMVASVAYGLIAQPDLALVATYTHPFLLEFMLGTWVAYAVVNIASRKISSPLLYASLGVASIMIALGAGSGDGMMRVVWFGVPAAIITFALVVIELQGSLPLSWLLKELGDASYSIYLTHPFVLTGFRLAAKLLNLNPASAWVGVALVLCSTFVAIVAGWIVHKVIEKPVLAWLRRKNFFNARPPLTVSAAQRR